jgi:hypothetical protein
VSVKIELKKLIGKPRDKWKVIIKMNIQRDKVGKCGLDLSGQG